MIQQTTRSGYILPFSFFILMFAIGIGYYTYTKVMLTNAYTRTFLDVEKARLVALAGVQIGLAQVAYFKDLSPEEKEARAEKSGSKTMSPDEESFQFFTFLWPRINVWQQYSISQVEDDKAGVVRIVLNAHDGKININMLYDFETHQFRNEGKASGDAKKLFESIFSRLEKQVRAKNLFAGFEKFLKERQYKLNDVTELMIIPEFKDLKHNLIPVYPPPTAKQPITLYDLFTVDGTKGQLDPWLLSASALDILNMDNPTHVARSEMLPELATQFKKWMNWPQKWNETIGKAYNKTFESLPKGSEALLNSVFEPKLFSILSYGTFGSVTQAVVAVIERKRVQQQDVIKYTAQIKKLTWL